MRSNCLFFAIYCWWRRGGYVAFRRSRHIGGLHFLWSPDLKRWVHYGPISPQKMPYALIHKLWYRGKIKRGD